MGKNQLMGPQHPVRGIAHVRNPIELWFVACMCFCSGTSFVEKGNYECVQQEIAAFLETLGGQ